MDEGGLWTVIAQVALLILKVGAQSPTRILDWVQLTTMPASSSSSPYNVEAENSVESSAIWLSMRSPTLSSAPLTTCRRPRHPQAGPAHLIHYPSASATLTSANSTVSCPLLLAARRVVPLRLGR